MRTIVATILAIASQSSIAAAAERLEPTWLFGAWKVTHDEDNTPPDIMAFKSGVYVSYGVDCAFRYEWPMHIHGGDVFVKVEWPKGPISIVFRPNADKTKLTFTSPRTRNNAIYEKLPSNPCE